MSAILRGLNSKKTQNPLVLPENYVVSKFFEIGPYPIQNEYNNTYQCCCPICKEGKSFGKKRRCFYIPSNDLIFCHNCGWSSKPLTWILKVSGMSMSEVSDEVTQGEFDMLDISNFDKPEVEINVPSLPEDCINLFDKSQVSFYSKNSVVLNMLKYLKSRNLLRSVNKPDAVYVSLKDRTHKNRLIIPFKDLDGKIVFYQSRKVFDWDEKIRYISKFNADKSLFNIHKVDAEHSDAIFAFEGPLDACFVKNGVAVAGITDGGNFFNEKQRQQLSQFKFFQVIWCLDSQYLDSASRLKSEELLKAGEHVFIWPAVDGKRYKDFNEMCIDKDMREVSHDYIKQNTFSGKSGLLKLSIIP
jgi:hypothetical protein